MTQTETRLTRYQAIKRFAELTEAKRFRFAKTMAETPHWYTLRDKDWESKDDFFEAVQLIRDYGYPYKWGRYTYIQLNVNEYFYWSMGWPVDETELINRGLINKNAPFPYDSFAEEYERYFDQPEYQDENERLFSQLQVKGKILDIGCGSGLLAQYLMPLPADYRGIDPSVKMLDLFKRKLPQYADSLRMCQYEDFTEEEFDTIVCLFGSLNYISPHSIYTIQEKLNPGGRYFLMVMNESYDPIAHKVAGKDIPYYRIGDYTFPDSAELSAFGNYVIVQGVK